MRRAFGLGALLALPVVVAACGAGSTSSATGAGAHRSVSVSITDAGCEPARLTVAAGPTTFEVENTGAEKVTEYEILDGKRILGEAENLAPGLSGKFSLTLKPGMYELYCPGGTSCGAPLGGTAEFDEVDLAARGADGAPVIPVDAHVRLAAPGQNAGIRILRRGYSFTDGMDQRLGQLDAGLFFIAFMRRPSAFVELQRRLGRSDALNEYITHNGSALFACPPGTTEDGYVGETLFA